MTDKKKLPDETLKDVSGGAFMFERREFEKFEKNNCMHCNLKAELKCPYGGSTKALQELGEDGICPKKEAM